jgi:hypothetical protein
MAKLLIVDQRNMRTTLAMMLRGAGETKRRTAKAPSAEAWGVRRRAHRSHGLKDSIGLRAVKTATETGSS